MSSTLNGPQLVFFWFDSVRFGLVTVPKLPPEVDKR